MKKFILISIMTLLIICTQTSKLKASESYQVYVVVHCMSLPILPLPTCRIKCESFMFVAYDEKKELVCTMCMSDLQALVKYLEDIDKYNSPECVTVETIR